MHKKNKKGSIRTTRIMLAILIILILSFTFINLNSFGKNWLIKRIAIITIVTIIAFNTDFLFKTLVLKKNN